MPAAAHWRGFDMGEFVHINLGQTDEEYVQALAADPDN